MLRLKRWIFISLLSFNNLNAQDYELENFSIADGLPQSEVSAIEEDHLGYLWIGTASSGVARFDGRIIERITTKDGMLSNSILDIQIDGHNNVWFVHARGLSKYDGKHFKTFVVPDTIPYFRRLISVWFENDTVHTVGIPRVYGRILNDSVRQWNKPFVGNREIITMARDRSGTLYCFLSGNEVLMRNGETQKIARVPVEGIIPKWIYAKDSSVVYGTDDVFIEVSFSLGSAEVARGKFHRNNWYASDTAQEFWHQRGDTLYHEKGSSMTRYFIGARIIRFLKDREQNIWLGTDRGLIKLKPSSISKLPGSSGLKISVMKKVGADLWIGTYGQGLYRYDGKSIKEILFYPDGEQARNRINDLDFAPSGQIWAATSAGLAIFDTSGKLLRWIDRPGFPLNGFTTIHINENEAWLGTVFAGTWIFDLEIDSVRQLRNRRHGGFSNTIYSAYFSDYHKQLIIGTERGMSFFNPHEQRDIPLPSWRNSSIVSVSQYQDSLLLIGTMGSGFILYSASSGEKLNFNSTNGLESDFVYYANADDDGFIWIGTERGVNQIRLNEDYKIVFNKFYPTDESDQEAFIIYNGDRYFGTINGLYRFNSSIVKEPKDESQLHFTSIKLLDDDDRRLVSEISIGDHSGVFKHRDHSFAFTFNRVNKSDPSSVRYSYKLDGVDTRWASPTAVGFAEYNGLPPGDYTFRVVAADATGNFEGEQLTYVFSITPPFYATTAFRIIAVLILLLACGAIVYSRIRSRINRVLTIEKLKIEQQSILRKEMARDFHDEMGNQLARIINFTSQLQLASLSSEYKSALLRKIEDTAKNVYNGAKEFIWSLNPESEDIVQLCMHIKEFGENLFAEKQISLLVDCIVDDSYKLPFGSAREISLIFKEAMTNTFKYSSATHVHLRLQRTSEGFEISVQDNGGGFNLQLVKQGNGFKNMMYRANRINADLSIHSEPGKGTSISLQIKTKQLSYEYVKSTLQEAGGHN